MRVIIAQRAGSSHCLSDCLPLPEILERADFISLHCPLTDAARDLIDAAALRRMKHSAFLINCARGGIVNERALMSALHGGEIAGAGVDVLSIEPPQGNVLLSQQLPNLIVTPHIAWASLKARQRVVEQLSENIKAYRNTAAIRLIAAV